MGLIIIITIMIIIITTSYLIINQFTYWDNFHQQFLNHTPKNFILILLISYHLIIILLTIRLLPSQLSFNLATFIYLIILLMILFLREQYDQPTIADGKYFSKWLKLIFKNKIVFTNVIGNIIIFIPFGISYRYYFPNHNNHKNKLLIKYLIDYCLILTIIIIIELTQYITKRGVLDLSDIILNYLGVLIGLGISRYVLMIEPKSVPYKGENYESTH